MIDSDELRVFPIFYTETAFVCTTFDFPMHSMNHFSWFNNLFTAITYVFYTQVEVIFNEIEFVLD